MSKRQQSIWTTDITPHVVRVMTADMTPHVVRVMTMDITPDFSGEFWQQDVSGHMLVTLAMFGLVVSAFVTTVGVATAGVNMEVALAQQGQATTQTAIVAAANMPAPAAMPLTASTSVPMACPQLSRTIGRGSDDATSSTDVMQLQQFMAAHFGLAASTTVSGHFGPITQGLLERFQQEQGIVPAPQAGPLTRAAIANLCGGHGQNGQGEPGSGRAPSGPSPMGSTSPMMGSTTPPMPPRNDMHPPMGSTTNMIASGTPMMNHRDDHRGPPPATTSNAAPVSINDNSSNTASLVEAVNEIGDGYGRLLQASLGMLGL